VSKPAARAVGLIVLDSVGIGGAPDAAEFGDEGSATLPNVALAVGELRLPHLEALGLGNIVDIKGVPPVEKPNGAFGSMIETSPGKDTTTGHWEIAGVILDNPFPTYPDGFPTDLVDEFVNAAGVEILGNVRASGTRIIEELGKEHLRTGKPIIYTSADSVWQIAAHIDVIPLARLYELCAIARRLLTGEHEVGRVIARPFRGTPGSFVRTADRHDLAVLPPRQTICDELVDAGLEVRSVGKVFDIFAHRGFTRSTPTSSNDKGVSATIEDLQAIDRGLVFTNLVDFDQAYGHRNDPPGYAAALEAFDRRLPEVVDALGPEDVLFLTADHGNDPTTESTDHSRERVFVLGAGDLIAAGTYLGERSSFTDLGATVTDLLGVKTRTTGRSFRGELLKGPAGGQASPGV
jgi:phosphopentomutase